MSNMVGKSALADKKRIRDLMVQADRGDSNAQCELAAGNGQVSAMCNLGYAYNTGQGVREDMAEAIKWYRKASERGDAIAQYNLGLCYLEGTGVRRSLRLAICWLKKAAGAGHKSAKRKLARLMKR